MPSDTCFRPGPVWGFDRLVSRAKVIENQHVGSHAPRVILFGAIPAIISVIPEVPIVPADLIVAPEEGIVLVVSPTEVLDLVDYSSSSNSDPSEDSLPLVPDLPLVSPSGSSSHDTLVPSSGYPLAPVVAPPEIRRRRAILIRPGEDIPIGRLYRTHPGGPCRALTARKSVRPLSSHRLALRYTSHHLDHFTSGSSSHSSSDHSSSGHSISGHSLSGHTPPDTTDADTSTPQRFVHRSLARTPRRSEAFRRWRSAPLSTPYPPTTSESSLGSSSERSLDSSLPSSRPSRKRCRDLYKLVLVQVMVAPIISISSDSSEESVGSHALRVIFFGAIPAIIPVIPEVLIVPADPIVAPEVGAVPVVSPTRVLDLVDYSSSSNSDPSEDFLPSVPDLPLVSPFGSSFHDTLAPLSEFPLAPIVAPPRIHRRSATLIRPGETIPFGRPCRTHLNGPHKLLTARKRVRGARRLAWRRVSHHSSNRHSSPDSSSSSSPSNHSLSGHTPPDITNADSSTPHRSVHQSLARTPRRSKAFRRWRSLDSSSLSSGPSRKRCRSPTTSIPSPTYDSRLIAYTPADLLPPRKRFRDPYSSEDSEEEHMEVDTADVKAYADVGISEGVVAHPEDSIDIGVEIGVSDDREDEEEFEAETSPSGTREIDVDPLAIGDSSESSIGGIPDLEDTILDIVHYMS
ncbi:hypothetical protein Tco_0210017 [Tanacetum coccineum]